MALVRTLPRWAIDTIRTALILALGLTVFSVYGARGDNHDTTFYACLYAGSFSQINTSGPPANCGRGQQVQWNSPEEQAEHAPAQIAGLITSQGTTSPQGGSGFTSAKVGTGQYNIMFPAGTWNGQTLPAPVVTALDEDAVFGVVTGVGLDPNGSSSFAVRFYDESGTLTDTAWFFVVTQT